MATSEVLLVKPIEGLGNEGDQITVRAGYARNYLLPQKIGVPVNRANKKQIEALMNIRSKREAHDLDMAQETAHRLRLISIAIAVKTGDRGKMFGAITSSDIIERLAQDGIKLDKKSVSLVSPIKTLGKHLAHIKLHKKVSIEFSFEVVSENPIEEIST